MNERRQKYADAAFRLVWQVAFIFGIPAIVAYFAGRKLDAVYSAGENHYIYFALLISFVLSWVILVALYRKLNRDFSDINNGGVTKN